MFKYFKSVYEAVMEILMSYTPEPVLGLKVRYASEEIFAIPRIVWFIQTQILGLTEGESRLNVLWSPRMLGDMEARYEAQTYGLSTRILHGFGMMGVDVTIGDVTTIGDDSRERFSLVIVPPSADAIEAAKRFGKVVLVLGTSNEHERFGISKVLDAPTAAWPRTPGKMYPETWEEAFGKPEPIPGIVEAVRKAIEESDDWFGSASNRFTEPAAQALTKNASIEEFLQAYKDMNWGPPSDRHLFYAGIDVELGRYSDTPMEVIPV